MRAAVALAAVCVAGGLAAAALPGGTASAAATARAAAAHATAASATSARSQSWVPPTPTYWPQVVGEQATRPVTITHGVQEYTENYQTVAGAQNAQIMDINLTDPNIRFGMVEAGNQLVDPSDEVISSMANRTGAVAGTNADEFAINTTGQPMGMVVQNGVLEASPVASWPAEVEVLNNGQFEFTTETFTGTADDTTSGSSEAMAGINRIDQTGLVLANSYLGAAPISSSVVATATPGSSPLDLTIDSVTSGVTSLPQLAAGQEDLFAAKGSAAATWLTAEVHAGDTITITDGIAPYGIGSAPTDVATAVSGAAYLVQNGQMAVPVTGGGENNVDYPVVGIGVTKNGKHAISVVFNGRESENVATGLTRPQEAQWFMAHGIYNAIEFDSSGAAPDAIGLWIKGIGGTPGTPLANGELTFAEALTEINGQEDVFYPTTVTYDGWQLITAAVPAGTEFPLTLDFLDFLVINPSETTTGDVYVADLQGLYSPRPPVTPTYTAIPQNPPWLSYDENPAQFAPGGVTVASFGDSHLTATDEETTGSVVTNDINADVKALPANAAPNMLQVVGNLVDPGTPADLQYGQQVLQSFGLPYHTAVGDSDIGQGAYPENTNWTAVFGDTHYSYTDGDAEFIVDDSAWEGLLASDPYQVSDQEQYAWLVSTLSASTSKVIFVVTHASPYDPHPVANSQFTDRYEAQMYEQLLANYQASHPRTHVILLNGQARGFAETVINPLGESDPNGLPNFDVADAGVTPYATTSQGGFYNYVLFHVLPDGTVQFAVQPVLASIAVTAPQPSLAAGAQEQLSATGTTPTGDNLTALQVPIADPASHLWSSSDPRIAAVDSETGRLIARSPGTATISVLSGGVTGSITITVTP
jgi:hypothetical protein